MRGVVLADEAESLSQLLGVRNISGWHEVDWSHVERDAREPDRISDPVQSHIAV